MRFLLGLALALAAACAPAGERVVSQVAGLWESAGGFEYSVIEIAEDGAVAWETGGCLDQASGRSHALYRDRKVVLITPVEEYGGDESRVYHHLWAKGREYLLTRGDLEFAREEGYGFDGGFWPGLRRRLPKPLLRRRFDTTVDGDARASLLEEWASWGVELGDLPFLQRVAKQDPSEAVRREATFALEWAGCDDFGDVRDEPLHRAAQDALDAG